MKRVAVHNTGAQNGRGEIGKFFLSPLAVVKNLYVFRNRAYSLMAGFVLPMENVRGLQRAPEALHGGIVVTVPLAANLNSHLGVNLRLSQEAHNLLCKLHSPNKVCLHYSHIVQNTQAACLHRFCIHQSK